MLYSVAGLQDCDCVDDILPILLFEVETTKVGFELDSIGILRLYRVEFFYFMSSVRFDDVFVVCRDKRFMLLPFEVQSSFASVIPLNTYCDWRDRSIWCLFRSTGSNLLRE